MCVCYKVIIVNNRVINMLYSVICLLLLIRLTGFVSKKLFDIVVQYNIECVTSFLVNIPGVRKAL